jgi:hypothetical protein
MPLAADGGSFRVPCKEKRPGRKGRALDLSEVTLRSEHDPEKWKPVFRKDHAHTKR